MRKHRKQASARQGAASQKRFADGVFNPLLRIGQGTKNTFNASGYKPSLLTFDRGNLEAAYQSSWMCSLAVDIIAEDMTREGVDIKCENPETVDRINTLMDDTRVWDGICDGLKWSRLYGGAIAVILIDGDDMSTPITAVRPGSFKGLCVLDRWQVQPSSESVEKLGPDFGKPKYYRVYTGASEYAFPADKIHYSRVIRFEGRRLPFNLRQIYQGWGASVLETLYDRIKMYDVATSGAAQLISKAYLRFYKVEGLRDIMTNEHAREGFLNQMEYVREFQSFEGMTIGDKEDEFQTMTYTFTGIPEIMLQFGQQISGAIGVPLVRLFGQSPSGLNSTGESDLRTYYDNVKHSQDTDLRPGLKRLLNIMYVSLTGQTPGPDFGFEFKSLWQMTNEQKAAAATGMAGAIIQSLQAGAITAPVAMRELKKLSDTVGIFASITDEDIQAAEDAENGMMPPGAEGLLNGLENVQGVGQNAAAQRVVSKTPPAGGETGGADRPAVQ